VGILEGMSLLALALSLSLAAAPAAAAAPAPAAYDAELSTYAYPFPVRFQTVQAQGQSLRLAYMDVPPAKGVKANGRTALLLHGKNFSGAYWARTAQALSARGYRVVIPDQVGFGKSSKPVPFQYSLHAMAAHTRALLQALGVKRAAVVGHSMGGMVAVRFALLAPEHTERLVLVNPIGLEDWKRQVPYRPVEALFETERQATAQSVRAYMQQSYFAGQWKPEYEPLVEVLAGWARGKDRERMAWVAALTTEMVFTQPVLYELPDLRTPTLLIIGERDRTAIGKAWAAPEVQKQLGNYPELGRRAAAAIPGAKLVALPGVGHLPQVEAWADYERALVDFLGR
jgi:pimeloyl-ACP methyl ester carboxylesterase